MNFEADHHLYSLDLAVQNAPTAAANYLLRAEHWLSLGELLMAAGDLQVVLHLTETRLLTSDWGYIDQSYRDRAEAMLGWINERLDG